MARVLHQGSEELAVVRTLLGALCLELGYADQEACAGQVQKVLEGAPEDVETFLCSNELWGGAGSIADQCSWDQDGRWTEDLMAAVVALGRYQLSIRYVAQRTHWWTSALASDLRRRRMNRFLKKWLGWMIR